MALYQPSFMVPHNEAIDVTDEDDMKFRWQLNGNNLLCAYNIQIYDIDTNKLVYELVSTENQRIIEENINRLSGYLTNQNNKIVTLAGYETEYKKSTLKATFKTSLESAYNTLYINADSKYNQMKAILQELKNFKEGKREKALTQSEITKFFQYWGEINNAVQAKIGKEENPSAGTAEYIKQQVIEWENIDPLRTDDIVYEGDVEIINDEAFTKVKDEFSSYVNFYENVMTTRASLASTDTSFMDDTNLERARKTVLLMYSRETSDAYYVKDLWEAVNKLWKEVNITKKIEECQKYYNETLVIINQETYALAHLSGGEATQEISAYSTTNATNANFLYKIPKGEPVAIINIQPQPPTGWVYIIYDGIKAYIQTKYLQYYNIKNGKYYLDNPMPPRNYNGSANIIVHQLPTTVLQNGKSYKWSVTLYWSTSGDYTKDNLVDGHLTSIESYFDARKKPEVTLDNLKQIFSVPYNYVEVTKATSYTYEDEEENLHTVNLGVGDSVLFLHLDIEDPNIAVVRYTTEDNKDVDCKIPLSCLEGTGDYESNRFTMYSKYATFYGGYKQEQHVSISYFRWVLCKLQNDTNEVQEVIKDTGMISSIDMKFYYDGFLNGEKYSIKLYVQTLDGVKAETPEYIFKVEYIDISVENMVNAENSPIEHGIIVEWSSLRLIEGDVIGTYSYVNDTPQDSHTSVKIDKGSSLVFDRDKGEPLSLDWDTNHVISFRIDEDRPRNQRYYAATGLDDNGDVIYRTLELVNRPDTQETGIADLLYVVHTPMEHSEYREPIYASPLYWYIIIMRTDGFIVYTKFADGLFPAKDLYASYNGYTLSRSVVPLPLRYYDEPSARVNYNYQTIVDNKGNYINDPVEAELQELLGGE